MTNILKSDNKRGIALAILAAVCYSVSSPLSKLILGYLSPTLMAGFLYLGAGVCMLFILLIRLFFKKRVKKEKSLSKKDIPYVIGMVLLDIAAPILMMFGLERTSAANASLLNNFEIVITSLVALLIFKEKISGRLWLGIAAITVSCIILSFESVEAFQFSIGSLLILLAAICWGFERKYMGDIRGLGDRRCGLWALDILLYLCSKAGRSRQDERLLCDKPIRGGYFLFAAIHGNPGMAILDCLGHHDSRGVACFKRQADIQEER